MARFDIFENPNPRATHAFYVDVQSNLLQLRTRWCIPLYRHAPLRMVLRGVQSMVDIRHRLFVLDTPNMLAVPVTSLRQKVGHLLLHEQASAESCIEFMLRGY